jgi:hypothetical protein
MNWLRYPILFCVVATATSATPSEWHRDLCLGRGGFWQSRVPVTIANRSDSEVNGAAVAVPVGTGDGEANLVGAAAECLRVCRADGVEMLWSLTDSEGRPQRRGDIQAGSTVYLPVGCPANDTTTHFIYFDNPSAWPVPDFLSARFGLQNGGFEDGDLQDPTGWRCDEGDADHQTRRVDQQPRSGKWCVKTAVNEGAEPTWIATRQSGVSVAGGARYRATAWVRGQNVKGFAGWYLHVGNASQSQLLNRTLRVGAGTFGWKKATVEFTAPKEADRLSIGTVLRGTGMAWYDDFSLEMLDEAKLTATAGAVERLELRFQGDDAPWPAPDDPGGKAVYRAAVRVVNATDQAMTSQLVHVDLRRVLHRLNRKRMAGIVHVDAGERSAPFALTDSSLLFEADVPARSVMSYWIYFGETAERPVDANRRTLASWINGKTNQVRNASFEQMVTSPATMPAEWSTGGHGQGGSGVAFGSVSPGYLDSRAARLQVPESVKPSWRGWHQDVAIKGGNSYVYGAWVKCESVKGSKVRLHAHCHDASGELCKEGAFKSVGEGIVGTTDWTRMLGMIRMPTEAKVLKLHLTMNATGTVWHDGVLVRPVSPGALGPLQSRSTATPHRLAVWPVNPIVKVFGEDVPPDNLQPGASIDVSAARNEFEPLQLALRSDSGRKDVRIEVDFPKGNGGKLTNIGVAVVGYVPVDYATSYYRSETPAWHRKSPSQQPSCDGWSGWWPDPLLPKATLDLPARVTRAAWLTVRVPKSATAGIYRGAVRVMHQDKAIRRMPFNVRVFNFTLPDQTHLKAIYDVRFRLPWWREVGGRGATTHKLWETMAQRRLSSHQIVPEPVFRYRDGVASADFARFDAAAETYFDGLGMTHAYMPWLFYGFGWGHPPRNLFGEAPFEGEYPYENTDRSRLRGPYKRAYQACLKLFWEHVKNKGWSDKFVLYISDEPHFHRHQYVIDQMKALCQMVHEVDPEIRIYASTWTHLPDWDGYLDIWGIGHDGRVSVEQMRRIRENGATIWFTTDGQMCLDTPYCAVERLLPHYCFQYSAKAYEFWGISWHTYDPYEFGWHSYIHQSSSPGIEFFVRYPNGDGYLVYPPHTASDPPVSSIRLEQAREGVEDYEYLHLLLGLIGDAQRRGSDTRAAEEALRAARELVPIPNAGGRYSSKILQDPDAVLRVRQQLADAIQRLSGSHGAGSGTSNAANPSN